MDYPYLSRKKKFEEKKITRQNLVKAKNQLQNFEKQLNKKNAI